MNEPCKSYESDGTCKALNIQCKIPRSVRGMFGEIDMCDGARKKLEEINDR